MTYAGIKFAIYKEQKGANGKTIWGSPVHQTAELNIENVSVQTASQNMTMKEGNEPKIIPFGVKGEKGRVATLTCSFKGRSMDSGTSMSADPYLDVLQRDIEGELGYALRVVLVGVGSNPLPELGTAKWRIEQFVWDRQARSMGQWKFNVELGYLWEVPNELQLYQTTWNFPDNVRYSAHIGIDQSSFNESELINNPKITTTVQQLNRATFTTVSADYDKDDIIHIYCETNPSKAVFFGIVKERRKNSNMTFTYDCIEIGDLLTRVMCAKTGTGLFKPRTRIPNPYKGNYLKLKTMVAIIMKFYEDNALEGYHPGYGVDKTTQNSGASYPVGEKDTIPNKTVKLPSQVISGMTVYKALNRVVEDQCGLYTWFDNDTGKMEYGYLRNLVTIDVNTDLITMSEETYGYMEDFVPDNVQLCDNNGEVVNTYPAQPVPGSTIQYKYNSDMNDAMIATMAEIIYNDLHVDNRKTYKVRFPAGTVKFRDGDVFTGLGDSTIDPVMDYRSGTDSDPLNTPKDAVWQIKEMTLTNEYTEVLVGPSYFSIFDLYKSALTKTDEIPAPKESKDVETNEIVAATQDTVTHTLE